MKKKTRNNEKMKKGINIRFGKLKTHQRKPPLLSKRGIQLQPSFISPQKKHIHKEEEEEEEKEEINCRSLLFINIHEF
jgi:hypothetical protein